MIIPMLDTLFNQTEKVKEVPALPEFAVSTTFAKDLFNHYFLKAALEQGTIAALLFVCAIIAASVILANVFRYLERVIATKIRVDIVRNMRMDFFKKITQFHIGYFNNEHKGDLISRFTNDVNEVESAVMNSLKAVLKEPITIIISFSVLIFLSPQLTLFTLIVLPITGFLLAQIINTLKKHARISQESLGRVLNILDETFSGMRVIKAFNARNFVVEKIDKETGLYRKAVKSVAYKNELAAPLAEILGVLIMTGIIYYGGNLVLNKEMEASTFIGFLVTYAMIIQPAKNFSNGITSLQRGTASAKRIFALMDTQPVIVDTENATILSSFEHEIEFRNVSFAYDTDPVLKNINLRISKGQTIALVGPSGGGKSTLADLIPRFYDPTAGELRVDGIPLKNLSQDSLRSQIGVVTQESILFNDTIFNNIAFGMPHVSEEDVIKAAKIANAHEFIIQTDDGYQTLIGERGSKLSGGQRQRLSIARAVLKNPPILILDEATSALDTESERLVQEALFNLMKNRTSIVIAHRLSTIQHADEILVIQNGEIIERGKHEQLTNQNGLYRKLSAFQGSAGL
jgi:subfamily B ATP-binding cassette protein MsbA